MAGEQFIFLGRLGREPDLRYTFRGGKPVCYLAVAENKTGCDKPVWRRVVVFGKQAELAKVDLKKGSQIFIQGHCTIREYEDGNGQMRNIEEVNAKLIGFPNV